MTFDKDRRIVVKSLVKSRVGLFEPYLNLRINWSKKGEKKLVPLDTLQQAITSPGVSELFTNGFLMIEEKDALDIMKYLNLEDADAEEPTKVIVLTDVQKKRLVTTAPTAELKEMLNKLPHEQVMQLADFAIDNELGDLDRSEIIKKASGIDIIQGIKLKRAEAEEVKTNNPDAPRI